MIIKMCKIGKKFKNVEKMDTRNTKIAKVSKNYKIDK